MQYVILNDSMSISFMIIVQKQLFKNKVHFSYRLLNELCSHNNHDSCWHQFNMQIN